MIPEDVIQHIRDRANITEVVGEVVALKRAGASLKGLCPFHGEKTPSFVVNPQQGSYHCFGCGAHGDSLTFIKETQHLNFPEAVKALAVRVGVEIVEEKPLRPEVREKRAQKKALEDRLFEVQEHLTQWYEKNLRHSSVAQSYLQQRQINPQSAQAFRLGWASDDVAQFIKWVKEANIKIDDLIALGVVIPFDPEQPHRTGDSRLNGGRLRFRNRLMCPIFDLKDRVVGYSGRVIDPRQKIAKYLNSPETAIFTKGNQLFGLKTAPVAMRSNQVDHLILCEGNLDVISLWQAGFPNSVAAMGTALSDQQAHLIKRLSPSVICVMDGDIAGQKAAFKSLPILLKQGLNVRGKLLPSEQDPDSFIREYGAASFKQWLADAEPLLMVRLKAIVQEYPKDPIGQAAIIKEFIPLIDLIQDEHQRPLFLDVIAKEIGVDRRYLSDLLVHYSQEQKNEAAVQRPLASSQTKSSAKSHLSHQFESSSYAHKQAHAGQNQYEQAEYEQAQYEQEQYEQAQYEQAQTSNEYQNTDSKQHHAKFKFNKQKKTSSKLDQERPWWANVNIQRGTGATRSRQFGTRPNGEAQLSISPAPPPPKSLQSSTVQVDVMTHLFGYEREAISTLFYSPDLLDLFLERGSVENFAHPGIQRFLLSVKRERDQGHFATGEQFFKEESDQALISAIKDSIAHPPIQDEKIDPERALNDLIKRLRLANVQNQLQSVVNELRDLKSKSLDSDFQGQQDIQERRQHLLELYQSIQLKLQALLPKSQSS